MTIALSPAARPAPALLARLAGVTAGSALLGIGVLHAAWGAGSSWPMSNRADLVDVVVGGEGSRALNGSHASYAVATVLGAAAAAVVGRPKHLDRTRRTAVAGTAVALAARGALGITGHTHLVSPASTGRRFRRLDRRIYSPLCLTLAGLTAMSLTGNRSPDRRS